MELDQNTVLIILGILLALSELLALNPKMKSNSIFTLIVNILRTIKKILSKKK